MLLRDDRSTNEWLKILIDNFQFCEFQNRFLKDCTLFLFLEFRLSLCSSINYTNIRVSSRRFVQNFNLETCLLYQWFNTYRICTFFMLKTIVGFPFHLFYQFHISTIFEVFLLDDQRLSLHSLLTKKSWIIFSRSTIKKKERRGGKREAENR